MTYKEIIKDIESGLTGDSEIDALYLEGKISDYKNHAFSEKILGFCIDLLLEALSEEEREQLKEWVERPGSRIKIALDEIEEDIQVGDYENAQLTLEALISGIEEIDDYEDNEEVVYRTFHEPFELIMYEDKFKDNRKEIIGVPEPFDDIYLNYGRLLIELKELKLAKEALIKGKEWNPVNANLLLCLADIYQIEGDLKKFLELTQEAFKIAFKPEQVTSCFINLGDYFSIEKNYSPARSCYNLASFYDEDNADINDGLKYVELATGINNNEVATEEIKVNSKKYNFPNTADERLIELAIKQGKEALNENNFVMARYYFEIADAISLDGKAESYLELLPED